MQLDFSYNWNNKLDSKYAFTTMRLSSRFKIGDIVNITLRFENKFMAEIVGKKCFKLDDINDFIAYIDTGYDTIECKQILKRMYSKKNIDWENQKIYFYLLRKVTYVSKK